MSGTFDEEMKSLPSIASLPLNAQPLKALGVNPHHLAKLLAEVPVNLKAEAVPSLHTTLFMGLLQSYDSNFNSPNKSATR